MRWSDFNLESSADESSDSDEADRHISECIDDVIKRINAPPPIRVNPPRKARVISKKTSNNAPKKSSISNGIESATRKRPFPQARVGEPLSVAADNGKTRSRTIVHSTAIIARPTSGLVPEAVSPAQDVPEVPSPIRVNPSKTARVISKEASAKSSRISGPSNGSESTTRKRPLPQARVGQPSSITADQRKMQSRTVVQSTAVITPPTAELVPETVPPAEEVPSSSSAEISALNTANNLIENGGSTNEESMNHAQPRPQDDWNDDEKKRLVDAVNIYGLEDIPRLQEAVGTRSVVDVLMYLKSLQREFHCPDSNLKTWSKIASHLLSNRRDHSTQAVKKLLQDRFWDEERQMQERSASSEGTTDLHFGRIYLHLSNAIDGKNNIPLSAKEQLVVQYLICDLGNCVRGLRNIADHKNYFGNIMAAYRRNTLTSQRQRETTTTSDISADALCSLNPFCIPNNLLDLPSPLPVQDVASSDAVRMENGVAMNGDAGPSTSVSSYTID